MNAITLKRTYHGEQIEVVAHMPSLVTGDEPDYDRADEDKGAPFVVTISKGDGPVVQLSFTDDEEEESAGDSSNCSISLKVVVSKDSGRKLEFTCTAFREEITIDDMLIVENTDGDGEEKFPYEGPEFT